MAFDVFLCHNSSEKPVVRQVAHGLKARGLGVWLDEWELIPGRPWQEALEAALEESVTAAVLVGADGRGPWQDREIRALLSQFVGRDAPVIPVLLPSAQTVPDLPLFLTQFTWVDLRAGITEDGLDRLQWGITGNKPGSVGATSRASIAHAVTTGPEPEQAADTQRNRAISEAILRRRKQLLGK